MICFSKCMKQCCLKFKTFRVIFRLKHDIAMSDIKMHSLSFLLLPPELRDCESTYQHRNRIDEAPTEYVSPSFLTHIFKCLKRTSHFNGFVFKDTNVYKDETCLRTILITVFRLN